MKHTRYLVVFCVVLSGTVGAMGCRRDEVVRRHASRKDARVTVPRRTVADLLAHKPSPATAAEREYDRGRRAALLAVVDSLEKAFEELLALAKKGAAEPAFREAWPARRAEFFARLGKIRSQALEVDPLGRRSHGARVAARLLGSLEVPLPNAVEESWSSRPGGALRTWSADFRLICAELRRYVLELKEPARKGTSHEHPDGARHPPSR